MSKQKIQAATSLEAIGALLMKHYPEYDLKYKKWLDLIILKKSPYDYVCVHKSTDSFEVYSRMAVWAFICFGAIIGVFLSGKLEKEIKELIDNQLNYLTTHQQEEETFFKKHYALYKGTHKYRARTILYNLLTLGVLFAATYFFSELSHYYYSSPDKESTLVCEKDAYSGKYGFVNPNGNWVIEPQFDNEGLFFRDGYFAEVKLNQIPCIINRKGEIVFQGKSEEDYINVDFEITPKTTEFRYKAAGTNEDLHGVINNETSAIVIPPKYNCYMDAVSEDIIACTLDTWEDTPYEFYDNNGEPVGMNLKILSYLLFHTSSPVIVWGIWLIILVAVNIVRRMNYIKKRKLGVLY